MKRLHILTVLLCAIAFTAHAQTLRVFNTDHDLSSSLINQLYQDRNGMLWVATEDGLNRYDGNKFTIYRHIPGDSTSLFSSYVTAMAEDRDGRLYACTRRGIQIFDPTTDSFSPRLKVEDGKMFASIANQIVWRKDNEYWVLGNSVRRFSTSGPDAFVLKPVDDLPFELCYVRCAITDRKGNLWISKNDATLYCISPDNTVRTYLGHPGSPSVSAMTIGADGQLYAGTIAHGLMRFNTDTKAFEMLAATTDKEIKNIFADKNGDLMLATDGDGIIIYTPSTEGTRRLRYGNGNIDSDRQKTHCMMRDADGNLWIAHYQQGVVMIPKQANAFGYIGHKSMDTNIIGHNCVSAIFRDSKGTLWVGADNDGIYAMSNDHVTMSHFTGSDINAPMCIFEDSRNNLWVGTYMHGVGIFDRNSGRLHALDLNGNSDYGNLNCMAMAEDRDHNLWLGMLNSGLMRYDLNTGRVDNGFSWRKKIDLWVASLYYSPKTNSLYVGTYSGLQVVNNVSLSEPTITGLLADDVVYCIDEAPDGSIWLATSNGLVRYEPSTSEYRRYDSTDGLHNNTVYAIRHDGHNLWMSLNSGLSRFDPATETFTNYLVDDGLQGNEFYKNSVFRDISGHLYFGGTEGITHFNPRDITGPGRKWTPRVVGLYTHGAPATSDVPVFEASDFYLEPGENTFSLEFGTRQLGRPESVLFAYSIDGKSWETLPAGSNIVNFHQLEPGRHTLRVKTIDSITESEIKTVTVTVGSPWYASPWAKALYALAAMMLIWWIVRSYAMRLRHRAELRELTHAEQLNEARLQSFVNISHEIRTPMSLVISPLQKLLAGDSDPARRREYGLILRNAKRILRLIDELMDLRKIEKRQMRLELRPTPLVPFVRDLCETFAQATAAKNLALDFNYDSTDTAACIDTANFDKILMNLLSNAVKYTPEGGSITIDLRKTENRHIELSVTDTGIGIPDDDKSRVFERFYQAHGNSAGGTGVGLHLTQQLVELHGGTLTVTDNPDSETGSRFTVDIPAGNTESTDIEERIPGIRAVSAGQPLNDIKTIMVPEAEPVRPEVAAARHHRILIVEDDEEIRQYLADELSRKYRVDVCANGREALDKIFARTPDLIISDIMMPVMDGIELTRAVKSNINLNHIPMIVVTAMTRDEDNIAVLEAGADDYVTKPFNIEIVRSKVTGLIERYQRLKNRYSGSQEHDEQLAQIEASSSDEKLMRRIMTVLDREMANPELSVEQLASEVGVSRVHLHRRMKALTNQSPRDFIRNTRLRQAARLLREKKLSVSEVADLTGFSNSGTFATSFKRYFGVTPTTYANAESGATQKADNQI